MQIQSTFFWHQLYIRFSQSVSNKLSDDLMQGCKRLHAFHYTLGALFSDE